MGLSWPQRSIVVALVLSVTAFVLAGASWLESRRQASDIRRGQQTIGSEPNQDAAGQPGVGGEWLKGTVDDRFTQVEKQLRGLDKTMVEVGYRFTELYFAGKEHNWDYAKYQAEKIDLAIRLGLERRPKRAQSAQFFLADEMPAVLKAIGSKDDEVFQKGMDRLRSSCMKCHNLEKVPFFTVEFPEHRASPVRNIQ
jgi:hypothetical protein